MCIKIGRLLTFHLHIVIGAWETRESLVNSEAIFNWFSGNLTCVLCLYHATLLFSLAPHCRKPKPPNWDESLLTFDFYKSLFTSENWYPRGWVFFGEQGCVPWTWTLSPAPQGGSGCRELSTEGGAAPKTAAGQSDSWSAGSFLEKGVTPEPPRGCQLLDFETSFSVWLSVGLIT